MPNASRVMAPGRTRLPYLDNLRTAMVAWIIGGHAFLGYAAIGGWPYDEVQCAAWLSVGRRAPVQPAAWARASYAAFALQVPVLLTLAITLRPVPWPAEAKAVLIAVLGVPASFWLGGRLVRTRLRQVL
jgi:hypothetical protein